MEAQDGERIADLIAEGHGIPEAAGSVRTPGQPAITVFEAPTPAQNTSPSESLVLDSFYCAPRGYRSRFNTLTSCDAWSGLHSQGLESKECALKKYVFILTKTNACDGRYRWCWTSVKLFDRFPDRHADQFLLKRPVAGLAHLPSNDDANRPETSVNNLDTLCAAKCSRREGMPSGFRTDV
jgi:hypothetical protein